MIDKAQQLARSILTGFERHFSFFQEITSGARERFEEADWEAARHAAAKRISFYDQRVRETIDKLRTSFGIQALDEPLWQEVKTVYTGLLKQHSRPELAETFYNSVFCQLFERKYFNNRNIFVESVADRAALASRYRGFMSFHPRDGGLRPAPGRSSPPSISTCPTRTSTGMPGASPRPCAPAHHWPAATCTRCASTSWSSRSSATRGPT